MRGDRIPPLFPTQITGFGVEWGGAAAGGDLESSARIRSRKKRRRREDGERGCAAAAVKIGAAVPGGMARQHPSAPPGATLTKGRHALRLWTWSFRLAGRREEEGAEPYRSESMRLGLFRSPHTTAGYKDGPVSVECAKPTSRSNSTSRPTHRAPHVGLVSQPVPCRRAPVAQCHAATASLPPPGRPATGACAHATTAP